MNWSQEDRERVVLDKKEKTELSLITNTSIPNKEILLNQVKLQEISLNFQ